MQNLQSISMTKFWKLHWTGTDVAHLIAFDWHGYGYCIGLDMGTGTGIQHFLKNLWYDTSRIRQLINLLIFF